MERYTDRCIIALLSLEKNAIAWPNTDDREIIKRRIEISSGFPNCIGFVDGTLVVFENRPAIHSEDFFNRKGRYGLATMIVCDDHRRIRYMLTGWPGCSHDTRVFNNSSLGTNPQDLFADGEYVLADSGYPPTPYVVPAFKRPRGHQLSASESHFNCLLSAIRVRVEQCIGILKGRFQSLKGLRILIRRNKDIRRCVHWVKVCCILHNLLIDDEPEEGWLTEEDSSIVDEGDDARTYGAGNDNRNGQAKRDSLMMYLEMLCSRNLSEEC